MTDAPKHPESLSRRDMIAATAAALVTPLLQGGAVSMQPVAGVPGKFLTAAEYALLDERSEEHMSELQSRLHLVCRLLLEKKKKKSVRIYITRSVLCRHD